MPRVSVIIPTYNRQHLVQQAIESVLTQVYADYEIVVVDDGSSDDTYAVVAGYKDPRVVYVYQPNAGRSAARNHGMREASGEYIAFLDDDDLYLSHKLAHQVAFLEARSEVGLVAGGAQLIDTTGSVIGAWRQWEDQPDLTLGNCLTSCPLFPSLVLLRRAELDRLDHWFDQEVEPAEDTDFFLRLLLSGCRMAWLPELVTTYRLHGASSQWDSARYGQARHRLLDKLFARADLPEDVRALRPRCYAQSHLVNALRCYASNQTDQGQEELIEALRWRPDLAQDGFPSTFATTIVASALAFWVNDPLLQIRTVFDHLPLPLAHLRQSHGEALSSLYMQRVFRAHSRGEHVPMLDWIQGVRHDHRWLRNRGVWSIAVRSLFRQGGDAVTWVRRCLGLSS